MKKSLRSSPLAHQLTGAAIALIAVCLFSFIYPTNPLPVGDEPGGGKSISMAKGKEMIANFPKWNASSGQKGGYLSKAALDAVFNNNQTASGIFWYMGTNAEGTTFNLIIEPGTCKYNAIDSTERSSIYMSETMCPTECGNLNR